MNAELARRLAQAPSQENLPAMNEERLDRVLLMAGVGEWKPYLSGTRHLAADEKGGERAAARPDRILYNVRYSRIEIEPDDNRSVAVDVTQYPTAEWAKYDILNNAFPTFLDRLSRFGHTIYQDGPYFRWSSGDKLILLECQGVLDPVIDEFLKAYLAKYPSSL